jgi:hypothetical protein
LALARATRRARANENDPAAKVDLAQARQAYLDARAADQVRRALEAAPVTLAARSKIAALVLAGSAA